MKIESADATASMEIVGESVVIRSRGVAGMLARGIQGEKTIAIRSITSVQVKLGTMFVAGYINLSYPGGKEFRGGMLEAAADPDTLIFNRAINAQVQEFAAEINRRRAEAPTSSHTAAVSTADELAKLAALHKSGVLSDEEFSNAKRKIIGG
jgi:hypothetical protein